MHKKVILCYGKTPTSPGRYLEEGFRELGVPLEVVTDELDGNQIPADEYEGIIFIESPKAPIARNMDSCGLPRMFWIHHGKHHLKKNLELIRNYQPNIILMAHSLHLAKHFPVEVCFFPFAVASGIFNSRRTWDKRAYNTAFVGRTDKSFYRVRNRNLRRIRYYMRRRNKPYRFVQNVTPEQMAQIYSNAKIVFNQSSDKVPETMNMRIFEALGCGALLLTNEVPKQEKLFKKDVHYIIFNGPRDMMRKLSFYLSRPDLASKIANQGYRHVMNLHTYAHRAQTALEMLRKLADKEITGGSEEDEPENRSLLW